MHTFYTIFNRFLSSFPLSCVCVSVDTTHIIIIFLRALSSTPKNKILPHPLAACCVEKPLARRKEVSTRPL